MNSCSPGGTFLIGCLLWAVGLTSIGWGQRLTDSYEFTIQPYTGVYRVFVRTSDRKPVSKNTKLQVVVYSQNYGASKTKVSREFVIKAGTNSARVDISLPALSNDYWSLDTLLIEDNDNGIEDPRDYLSQQFDRTGRWQQLDRYLFVSSNVVSVPGRKYVASRKTQMSTAVSSLSVIDRTILPTFKELADYYEANQILSANAITTSLSFLQNVSDYIQCVSTTDFFDRWTCLCSYNAIMISWADLQLIAKTKPQLEALKKWVAVGGQLCVFDFDKDYSGRDKVMQLLTGENLRVKWHTPSSSLVQQSGFFAKNVYRYQAGLLIDDGDFSRQTVSKTVDSLEGQPLIHADLLHGKLILVEDDMTTWKANDWQLLFNYFFLNDGVEQTIGSSVIQRSFDSKFRIPGIGNPPVLVFQVLITLFVLLVGPVFYFLFQQSGRLYLLLVAVPLLAIFAVLSLVAYATISDGFSIQGRINSLTRIDHRAALATHHSRSSFYAGISPGQFVFDDAMVMDSRNRFAPVSQFKNRNQKLFVSGGLIRARSPFQLTSLDYFEIDKQITFAISSSNPETGTVTNPFDFDFKVIVVRSGDKFFLAKDIPAQSAAVAAGASFNECLKKTTGVAQNADKGHRFRNSNTWGEADTVIGSLNSSRLKDEIPENGYLAISETNDLVEDIKSAAIYEGNQLHVIIGKW